MSDICNDKSSFCQPNDPEVTLSFQSSYTAALVRTTHLLVNLSLFQTVYLLPPQISITIQAPERPATVFLKSAAEIVLWN